MNHRDHFNSGIRHGQAAQASDSVQAQYGAAQAQPISQVDSAIGQVSDNMCDLQATIQRLTTRLGPVLNPPGIGSNGTDKAPLPATPAPLVGRIEDLSEQLREACAALQDLERRLAL
ncbi:hypothetical protein [Delftia acidovorans]|uniref:hypothetical protein n=1 Tax=Delftia acidovorans TaxID=80866 RepID=UPI000BD8EBA2|nr:hypothetical protein [Delftia acidovorans]SOE35262.1 hypothetical protein SAMN05216519_1242 [Delftia acidovorans]